MLKTERNKNVEKMKCNKKHVIKKNERNDIFENSMKCN